MSWVYYRDLDPRDDNPGATRTDESGFVYATTPKPWATSMLNAVAKVPGLWASEESRQKEFPLDELSDAMAWVDRELAEADAARARSAALAVM